MKQHSFPKRQNTVDFITVRNFQSILVRNAGQILKQNTIFLVGHFHSSVAANYSLLLHFLVTWLVAVILRPFCCHFSLRNIRASNSYSFRSQCHTLERSSVLFDFSLGLHFLFPFFVTVFSMVCNFLRCIETSLLIQGSMTLCCYVEGRQ